MLHTICQVVILFCGVCSVLLVNSPNPKVARFACLFGLACQPPWAYEMYTQQQWGVLALTNVYVYGWARGFYHFWIKKESGSAS